MPRGNSALTSIRELSSTVSRSCCRQIEALSYHKLLDYSNIFSLLTRMRQMACHPDLVLRSKSNTNKFIPEEAGEVTVCRLCNDIAEDAIQGKCKHIFDRECIKQYLEAALEDQVGYQKHLRNFSNFSLNVIACLPCLSFAINNRLGSAGSRIGRKWIERSTRYPWQTQS